MSKLIKAFEKYGVNVKKPKIDNAVLFIGTLPSIDNELLTKKICKNSPEIIYFSPMEDPLLHPKANKYIKYEIGSEVGVLALLAKALLKDKELNKDVRRYIDELDDGYLSAESNTGEEEIEECVKMFTQNGLTLLLGDDLHAHPDVDTIAGLIALISRFEFLRISLLNESELNPKPSAILPSAVDNISSFDGTTIYFYIQKNESEKLLASSQFATAAKIKDKDNIAIITKDKKYEKIFKVSEKLKGVIALLGVSEKKGYRYEVANVIKKAANG
ncbi:MAG: hypothetical protein LBD84_00645 [Campylobacteraceae bacterium]|jgi:NADH-quinone oxidoreductase subunit F|nr:hypothetical protein [Campylobacteraceae bacterium]